MPFKKFSVWLCDKSDLKFDTYWLPAIEQPRHSANPFAHPSVLLLSYKFVTIPKARLTEVRFINASASVAGRSNAVIRLLISWSETHQLMFWDQIWGFCLPVNASSSAKTCNCFVIEAYDGFKIFMFPVRSRIADHCWSILTPKIV